MGGNSIYSRWEGTRGGWEDSLRLQRQGPTGRVVVRSSIGAFINHIPTRKNQVDPKLVSRNDGGSRSPMPLQSGN